MISSYSLLAISSPTNDENIRSGEILARLGQVDHKKNAKGTEASPTGQRVPRWVTVLPWETRTSNHEATKAERRRQHKRRRQPSWNALREQREWGREETRTCKHERVSPLYLSRGHCKAPHNSSLTLSPYSKSFDPRGSTRVATPATPRPEGVPAGPPRAKPEVATSLWRTTAQETKNSNKSSTPTGSTLRRGQRNPANP